MRVLSLNVNNFGGNGFGKNMPRRSEGFCNEDGSTDWAAFRFAVNCWRDNPAHDINASEILAHISDYGPNVVILHEFDIGSKESKKVINVLSEKSYNIVYPNKASEENYRRRNLSSISVMFVRNDLLESTKNPPKLTKSDKWIEIEYKENVIIGVHVPYDEKFWDAMIEYYSINKNKKLMIIGDLNVFEMGTNRRVKFDELLSHGAIDVWLAKGNSNDTPTFEYGSRIDYALMSPSLYSENVSMITDPVLREKKFTDHSSIIIDL